MEIVYRKYELPRIGKKQGRNKNLPGVIMITILKTKVNSANYITGMR
jgi:hypothetical protein